MCLFVYLAVFCCEICEGASVTHSGGPSGSAVATDE